MEIENIVGNCRDEWMVCVCEIWNWGYVYCWYFDILIFFKCKNMFIVWGGEWVIVNLD